MDLEGYARKRLSSKEDHLKVKRELVSLLGTYKNVGKERLDLIAEAVLEEVEKSGRARGPLFDYRKSNVSMGEMGVGSRGEGDFFVHRQIAELVEPRRAIAVSPADQDDAGVIRHAGNNIVVSVDGTHSRLSDFPFLAGFHVARAAARDVCVMGARPLAFFADLHLADDGDVSKLFDFMAGVNVVSSHLDAPVIAGSTLRVGGDMVIGDRMVSGVGCVGVGRRIWARRDVRDGDVILMTSGSGGGTITTAAIYSGMYDVVSETINLDFLRAAQALLASKATIHAATDVTNGGVRGDCFQMAHTACVTIELEREKIESLVNPRVRAMLSKLQIDSLGVSLDSLLVMCPPSFAPSILRAIRKRGIHIDEIGRVRKSSRPSVLLDGKKISPKFRESAYTRIKKIYGESTPEHFAAMKRRVREAQRGALEKMDYVEGLLASERRRLH